MKEPSMTHDVTRARRSVPILLALVLSLASCATSYGAKGLFGGFEEQRIDDTTLRVHFQGNGFTSRQTVETYTLRRCAELTRQNGFDWFVVVDGETEVGDTQIHSGNTSSSHTSGVAGLNSLGNVDYGSNTTTWTGPSSTVNVRKYDSAVMIKMFHGEKPADVFNAYVADEVIANLGSQA